MNLADFFFKVPDFLSNLDPCIWERVGHKRDSMYIMLIFLAISDWIWVPCCSLQVTRPLGEKLTPWLLEHAHPCKAGSENLSSILKMNKSCNLRALEQDAISQVSIKSDNQLAAAQNTNLIQGSSAAQSFVLGREPNNSLFREWRSLPTNNKGK